jgi:hypothetical protein
MSPSAGPRAALVAWLCCAAACAEGYAREVDETRAGLLGRSGLELRECLGVPIEFEIDGDVERQTYRVDRDDPPPITLGHVISGGGIRGLHLPSERGSDPDPFPPDLTVPTWCELDFELTKGHVTSVAARGRSAMSTFADPHCLLVARRCLSYDSPETEDAE